MKIAYIAGPYRAKTKLGVLINIIRARKAAKKYWQKGYAVICPHSNSALFDSVVPDQHFLDGDIEILSKCDVIVMIKGWQKSSGARNELSFALENRLTIIGDEG